MANMLMMRYAASRGNENQQGGNRNEMNGGMESAMRSEMRGGSQNAYNRGMTYDEMENRGEYGGGAESRYRGRDGRWKSGRRRSEYEGGMMTAEEEWPEDRQNRQRNTGEMRQYDRRRSGGDDEEEEKEYEVKVKPSNVIEWPYGQPEDRQNEYRSNRQIGFGAQNNTDEGSDRLRDDYSMGRSGSGGSRMDLDRKTAEHWVRNMQNEDKSHPMGGKWSPDMLKPLAQKYGIPTEGTKFWEFYAITNAMYSNYGEVARKFGITSPEFYVCMAKAWMNDKDAKPNKTALYYEYIVEKDGMGSAA